MYTGNIARRYAVSLLRFSEEQGCSAEVYREARAMESVMKSGSEAAHAFYSPLASEKDKIAAVGHAVGKPLTETMRKFLTLVIRHRRCAFMRYILASFCRLYRERNSIRQIEIRTAQPLSEQIEEQILDCIAGPHSADEITRIHDSALVGGYVVRMDDMLTDRSSRKDLDVIRQRMVTQKTKR